MPSAFNLARFKVSGKLPTLQVNLSDTKYKSLMRLIDVCIPKFEDKSEVGVPVPPPTGNISRGFQLASGLFGQTETEYNVDDDDEGDDDDGSTSHEEHFFEAEDGTSAVRLSVKRWSNQL